MVSGTARPWKKWIDFKWQNSWNEDWNFGKIMLQKEILNCFNYYWGLRVKKNISKFQVFLKPTWKNCGSKSNIIFPPFQHVYDLVRDPSILWIFCSSWELDFKRRGRTLWAVVWSYTQDEIYWPIPGQVLDFCERVTCHS